MYGTRGGCSVTSTPNRRCIRSSVTSTCICERPATIVSPVCGSRWMSSEGSSSCSRRSDVCTFSSSPLCLGSMANDTTGDGNASGSIWAGLSTSERTSPVPVSLSLATAPMAPAGSESVGVCSLPCSTSSWPMRSLAWVWLLTSVESDVSVPAKTRSRLILPL